MNLNDLRRKALIGKSAAERAAAAIKYTDQFLAKAGNKAKYRVGQIVVMTDDAIDNYGEEWRDVPMRITHVATKQMNSRDFFAQGRPEGYHPGYDEGAGGGLYDLERVDGGEVNMSLYDWELTPAPADAGKAARPALRKAAFKPGDKVFHEKYGLGVVTDKKSGESGEFVGVAFDAGDTVFVMPARLELRESAGAGKTRTVGGDSTKPQGYIVGRKAARPAMRKIDLTPGRGINFTDSWEAFAAAAPHLKGDGRDFRAKLAEHFERFPGVAVKLTIDTETDGGVIWLLWGSMANRQTARFPIMGPEDEDESNARQREVATMRQNADRKASRPAMRKGETFTPQELKEAFGRSGHFGVRTDDETWQKVADLMNGVHGDKSADAALEQINTLLRYHGVEGITPEGEVYSKAIYVNTGDTYSTTILYDYDKEEVQLTTWGDWLEEWERDNAQEEEPDSGDEETDENAE